MAGEADLLFQQAVAEITILDLKTSPQPGSHVATLKAIAASKVTECGLPFSCSFLLTSRPAADEVSWLRHSRGCGRSQGHRI